MLPCQSWRFIADDPEVCARPCSLSESELVFPGRNLRQGDNAWPPVQLRFRSNIKDWCAEVATMRDEVSEVALANPRQDRRGLLAEPLCT